MTEARRVLTDECAWCSDCRHQHNEKGCRICGRYPWERGAYYCDGFVEKGDADARGERLMQELGVQP